MMISKWTSHVIAVLAVVVGGAFCEAQDPANQPVKDGESTSQPDDDPQKGVRNGLAPPNPFPRTTNLEPDLFDLGNGWLNTDKPVSMTDLKGKIVVLDFWTYCCINCMHVLPDLKHLERKYSDQIVVIGIHSAKFENEKERQHLKDAILRYEIEHPVINDSEMKLWNRFGIRAWPTLALINPEGALVGIQPGEGNRQLFDRSISKLIRYHRWKGNLNEKPMSFLKSPPVRDLSQLHYPGKVLVDERSNRLFVSDSSNHRIVVCDLDGSVEFTIGTGDPGLQDGGYETAMFKRPQGMALDGDRLYVADTDNHSIRIVDLETSQVTMLVGNGKQAAFGSKGGALSDTQLNSPWDVVVSDGRLLIAMAGSHQIWSHELGGKSIEIFAGNGREDIVNGRRESAAFAQPSDLALSHDFERLYVADSEGSAIRRIDLDAGFVSTVVGPSGLPRGQSLFQFGDIDGVGAEVRLQHPLAVTTVSDGLLVADSYNHKIKRILTPSLQTSSWIGHKPSNEAQSALELAEPGDVEAAGEFVFIADTNHHRILKVNRKTQAVTELPVEVPVASKPSPESDAPASDTSKAQVPQ